MNTSITLEHGRESHHSCAFFTSDWKSNLLVSKPPAECRYSNTREERHSSSQPHLFQQEEQSYAFPTWLGRCQSLDIRRMGASYLKEGYSHKIIIAKKAIQHMVTKPWLCQHMSSILETIQDRVTSCSRFSNNNRWKMMKSPCQWL